jgi:DNA-binding transcriptional regulator GbsR (MarR family)
MQTVIQNNDKTTSNKKPVAKGLSYEELAFANLIENIVEQWGFKHLLGRVWSILYLREKPMNQSQIEEELNLSKGNINGLIMELLKWGVIRKVRVPNDRNYYYEVDQLIWKSIANVIQARELRILDEAITRTVQLQENLKKAPQSDEIKHQVKRLQHVKDAFDTVHMLTKIIVSSPEKIEKMSKIVSKLRNL